MFNRDAMNAELIVSAMIAKLFERVPAIQRAWHLLGRDDVAEQNKAFSAMIHAVDMELSQQVGELSSFLSFWATKYHNDHHRGSNTNPWAIDDFKHCKSELCLSLFGSITELNARETPPAATPSEPEGDASPDVS